MTSARDDTDGRRIDASVLEALLEVSSPVGIEELGRRVNERLEGVRGALGELARAGCELEYDGLGRVRLRRAGLGVWSDYLSWAGGGRWAVSVYGRTTSTQDAARRMVEHGRGGEAAIVVVSDELTAGRGRLGRRWYAPPEAALMFSRVVMEGAGAAERTGDHLTLLCGVAVARAVEGALGEGGPGVRIDWPNDIMVEDRKLAGILVERCATGSGVRAAIVGIGINVGLRPEDLDGSDAELRALRDRVTSFAMLGRPVERLHLLRRVLERLDEALEEGEEAIAASWRGRDRTIGRRVEAMTEGRRVAGEVVDIDAREGLILRTGDGVLIHLRAATSTVLSRG